MQPTKHVMQRNATQQLSSSIIIDFESISILVGVHLGIFLFLFQNQNVVANILSLFNFHPPPFYGILFDTFNIVPNIPPSTSEL